MSPLLRAIVLVPWCLAAARADAIPEIWKAKCKSCHGEDGKANTKTGKKEKIEDMTLASWQAKWTDEKMRKIISDGSEEKKKMKPFKEKLSPEEIDGLIKHIRGFKP